jgi:hypothetical protein
MKKQKRSSPYEDKVDPMRDLNVDIGSPDDDDIIDLEDIIEMPDSPINEDEDLDLDAKIFDLDPDLDPLPGKVVERLPHALGPEEEELMKLIGDESEEEEVLFEPSASEEHGKPPTGKGEPLLFEEEESFPDESADGLAESEFDEVSAEKPDELEAKAAGAPEISEDDQLADIEPEAELADEPVTAAPMADEATIASAPSADDLSQTAEELIGRIESRLQEHIRVMVETMLPDLVRAIIHEEIENLKEELGLTEERIL